MRAFSLLLLSILLFGQVSFAQSVDVVVEFSPSPGMDAVDIYITSFPGLGSENWNLVECDAKLADKKYYVTSFPGMAVKNIYIVKFPGLDTKNICIIGKRIENFILDGNCFI